MGFAVFVLFLNKIILWCDNRLIMSLLFSSESMGNWLMDIYELPPVAANYASASAYPNISW